MAGGALGVLVQPSEFVVIDGGAVGRLLMSTPPKTVKMLLSQFAAAFGSGPTRSDDVDLLSMQYQIFKRIQQSAVMALRRARQDAGLRAELVDTVPGHADRTPRTGDDQLDARTTASRSWCTTRR